MIQQETILKIVDNTGAKEASCIRVLGGSAKKYGTLGDIIVVNITKATPDSTIEKGSVQKAVIVRVKKEVKRKDGIIVRFDDNACVLLDANKEPIGTRIFGPVAEELRDKGFMRLISLASEVQ
ncbi:MAG: 50S ribosomal protein L14 [candidate division WOR-3 bacterium]